MGTDSPAIPLFVSSTDRITSDYWFNRWHHHCQPQNSDSLRSSCFERRRARVVKGARRMLHPRPARHWKLKQRTAGNPPLALALVISSPTTHYSRFLPTRRLFFNGASTSLTSINSRLKPPFQCHRTNQSCGYANTMRKLCWRHFVVLVGLRLWHGVSYAGVVFTYIWAAYGDRLHRAPRAAYLPHPSPHSWTCRLWPCIDLDWYGCSLCSVRFST